MTVTIVTRDGQEITGNETIDPMMALPIGPCLAAMHEYPGLRCRVVDVPSDSPNPDDLARRLAADLAEPAPSIVTAYRGNAPLGTGIQSDSPCTHKEPTSCIAQEGRLSDNSRARRSRSCCLAAPRRELPSGPDSAQPDAASGRDEWSRILAESQRTIESFA